jgi:hypothetical protein
MHHLFARVLMLFVLCGLSIPTGVLASGVVVPVHAGAAEISAPAEPASEIRPCKILGAKGFLPCQPDLGILANLPDRPLPQTRYALDTDAGPALALFRPSAETPPPRAA